MQASFHKPLSMLAACSIALATAGCGTSAGLLNPAFLNTIVGGQVPVTPGPTASFVLVRAVNETAQTVEFIVTVERQALARDANGEFLLDEAGGFITRPERETKRLLTQPTGLASDLGVLFDCSLEPITLIGLGDNLLPTDPAVFVGGGGAGDQTGFGVIAPNLNPLRLDIGNFNCGDAVIYRAFTATGVAGGVRIESFLLPHSEQPSEFVGPSTFENLQNFLDSQQRENEE